MTANLNLIDYDTVRKIGAIVRRCAREPRHRLRRKKHQQRSHRRSSAKPANMYAGINARSRASTDKASGSFIWDTASMRPYRSPPA